MTSGPVVPNDGRCEDAIPPHELRANRGTEMTVTTATRERIGR